MKRLIIILLLFSTSLFAQDHDAMHIGTDVAPEKQMVLNDLNYARQHPQTYAKTINVNLSGFDPMGVLDTLSVLNFYAQWYSERLFENAPAFNHSSMNYAESILWNYDVCVSIDQFIIDEGVPDLGHRRMLLNRNYTHVGIGITKGWVGRWYRTYVVILTM